MAYTSFLVEVLGFPPNLRHGSTSSSKALRIKAILLSLVLGACIKKSWNSAKRIGSMMSANSSRITQFSLLFRAGELVLFVAVAEFEAGGGVDVLDL